jgi:hypothetical protein
MRTDTLKIRNNGKTIIFGAPRLNDMAADGCLKSKNQPKTGSHNGGKYGVEVQ